MVDFKKLASADDDDKPTPEEVAEEAAAEAAAMEFPPKEALQWTGKGEAPWGPNRSVHRGKQVDKILGRALASVEKTAEEVGGQTYGKKERLREWAEACALWKEGETHDDREFRLKLTYEKIFGQPPKHTDVRGRELGAGKCCRDGLLRTTSSTYPVKALDGRVQDRRVRDGYALVCRVCDDGSERRKQIAEMGPKRKGRR